MSKLYLIDDIRRETWNVYYAVLFYIMAYTFIGVWQFSNSKPNLLKSTDYCGQASALNISTCHVYVWFQEGKSIPQHLVKKYRRKVYHVEFEIDFDGAPKSTKEDEQINSDAT